MSDYREQDSLTNVPLYAASIYLKDRMEERQKDIDQMLEQLI
jgi:hypothetical protein